MLVDIEWLVVRLAVGQYFPDFKMKVASRKLVWKRLLSAVMFKLCW